MLIFIIFTGMCFVLSYSSFCAEYCVYLYPEHNNTSFTSFNSTLLGSGLLVLSQYPIERTGFHPFALCGYPEDALRYQLDCLCGKGVAYAVVRFNGLSLMLFNTHVCTIWLWLSLSVRVHWCMEVEDIGICSEWTGYLLGGLIDTHWTNAIWPIAGAHLHMSL